MREWAQRAHFDWFTHPHLCLALDSRHPWGASHHQKLVMIDDNIAFLGGIDLTANRLDGAEHRPFDAGRRSPNGTMYEPYHDVQLAASGLAAQVLGGLARERWRCVGDADGKALTVTPDGIDALLDLWPMAEAFENAYLGPARARL